MGEQYRRVLRLEADNPPLPRNYGKYLHEVERNLAGAEEYYTRALLTCPGDDTGSSLAPKARTEEEERAAPAWGAHGRVDRVRGALREEYDTPMRGKRRRPAVKALAEGVCYILKHDGGDD